VRWIESLAEDSVTLQAYLRAIARFPSISDAEESALAERARRRDAEALARLVESHLGLVVRYVRRYQAVGVPLVALVRDGNLALIEAARRFDPVRHGRFGEYALWWLRQSVLHRMSLLAPADGSGEPGRYEGRTADALRAAVDYACAPGVRAGDELTAGDVEMLDGWWRRAPLSQDALVDEPFDLDAVAPAMDEPEEAVRRALVAELETSLLELEPGERRALECSLGLESGAPPLARAARSRVSPARAARLSARAVRKLCGLRYLKSALN
jgi:RNA polymerase primary sigma factor